MGRPAKSTRPMRTKDAPQTHQHIALWQQAATAPTTTPNQTKHKKHKYALKAKLNHHNKAQSTKHSPTTNTLETISDAQANHIAQQFALESEQINQIIGGEREDELKGYSQDEIIFLKEVLNGTRIRPDNMIELPLPFTEYNPKFPVNRRVAMPRTANTLKTMQKKQPEFFQKSLEKFAKNVDRQCPRFEPVPPNYKYREDGHAYWIPLFSVKQKGKARIVFDSAARTEEVCINDKLRKGPDRNNKLLGVVHRFRRHPFAVTADVENMFHQFAVPNHQRTYLRFFW